MGTISDERRKFYLEYIRKIITKRPAATIKEIGECLIDNGLHLNKNTIDKYVKKIDGERTHRISHQLVKVVSTAQDGMNIRVAKLNEIIDNPMCEPMEKIAAMREWREETTKFIETLMNSGVLEKQLGKIKLEVSEVISPSVLAAIECLRMQFSEKIKPVIYEEAIIVETKDEPKPEVNPNIRQLTSGATIDDKGPAIADR